MLERCGAVEVEREGRGCLVEAVFEDGGDGAVAVGAEGERAAAGGLEARIAVVLAEAQDAETGAVGLASGWRRSRITVATSVAVAGPVFSAQPTRRSGVHSPIWRCASGICSGAVVWRPFIGERRWLATRSPRCSTSTVSAL